MPWTGSSSPSHLTLYKLACCCCLIMGGYLLILPTLLPFSAVKNWNQNPVEDFTICLFHSLKKSRCREDGKSTCVTMRLFPNPSVNRQTEEGCTHFHFSALVEKKKKKDEDLLPLWNSFHAQVNKNIFVQHDANKQPLGPPAASRLVHETLFGPFYSGSAFRDVILVSFLSGLLLPPPTLHQGSRLRLNDELSQICFIYG